VGSSNDELEKVGSTNVTWCFLGIDHLASHEGKRGTQGKYPPRWILFLGSHFCPLILEEKIPMSEPAKHPESSKGFKTTESGNVEDY
jgi:hypothetical protein